MRSPKIGFFLLLLVVMSCVTTTAFAQASSSYQTGTIMSVKPHPSANGESSDQQQYDISVKVGTTIYTVVLTPPPGSDLVKYKEGLDLPVRVNDTTITFNHMTGESVTLPIVSKVEAPPKQEP